MIHRIFLSLALMLTSAAAFAHGTGQHVLGTVAAIDETHIEVKTPKGRLFRCCLIRTQSLQPSGRRN